MSLLHAKEFRFRAVLYWGCSWLAAFLAWRTPGLDARGFAAEVAGTAVGAFVAYRYVLWLQRLERRYRHVHPKKFRVRTIAGFYLMVGLAVVAAGLTPPLSTRAGATPLACAFGFFLAPVFLAAAAGIMRGTYEPEAP
jgi:hypothetical protein